MAEQTIAKQQAKIDMLEFSLQQGRGMAPIGYGAPTTNDKYHQQKQMGALGQNFSPSPGGYQDHGPPADSMVLRPGTAAGPSFLSHTDRGNATSFNEVLPGSGRKPKDGLDVIISCPITGRVMSSAVLALDGHTYERQAIESWFATHGTISPVSGRRLDSKLLVPNHTVRSIIKLAGLGGGLSSVATEALAVQVPTDVLDFVFLSINGRELAMCSMVCSKWQRAADEDSNWCWMMEQQYDAASAAAAMEGTLTYKQCYRAKHLEAVQKRRAAKRAETTTTGLRLLKNT